MGDVSKPMYDTTQQELYSLGDTIFDNALTDIATLFDFKSKYTAGWIADRKNQVESCRNMPGEVTVAGGVSELKVILSTSGGLCTNMFQSVKRYIDDWKKTAEERKIAYNALGQARYRKAVQENWEELQQMNTEMKAYVTTNEALLKSQGFMPASFLVTLTAAETDFNTKYANFKTARQTSAQTDAKIDANNELYKEITLLSNDGKFVYKDDEGLQKRYIISALMDIISPPGAASLTVKLTRDVDFTPIAGAQVKIQKEGEPAKIKESNADGESPFASINSGRYVVTVTIGTEPVRTFNKEVNVGVNARMDLVIAKV